jgi:chitodextrinase
MSATQTTTAWSSVAIYTAGMTVTQNGVTYVANWWTDGNDPASNNGVIGTGQPWTIVTTTTVTPPAVAKVVPTAPTALRLASDTSSTATLSWTASTVTGGGSVTGYGIHENGKLVATVTGTTYNAAGLTAATAYSFAVAAIDSVGSSAKSAVLAVTTPAAPKVAAYSSTAIYTAGMTVAEGGIIYKANWWTQGSDPVTASGAIGTGEPWTAIGKVSTSPTVPDAPTALTAISASSTAVVLNWDTATISGTGTVSGYAVFENGTEIATTNTYYDVGSLKAATAYKFSVVAIDATGASAQSATATATTLATGAVASTAVFAPYIDMGLWGSDTLADIAKASGIKTFTLAFVQSSGAGTIGWAGTGTLPNDSTSSGVSIQTQVAAIKAAGGNVIVSFGGEAGTDPATTATSVAQLQAEYQSVIARYGVTSLDFDIEGAPETNQASLVLRDKALIGLEKANPGLTVSYTLPVLPTGLDANGLNILHTAAAAGVNIGVVNIMAMDFGSSVDNGGAMGTDAIDAIKATEKQVAAAGLTAKVGVTVMIGVNDVSTEVFTLADANQLAAYVATDPDVARVAMWSVARDNGATAGAHYASNNSSGVAETPYQFSSILEKA